MDEPTPNVIDPAFKDRRGGLIAFGIVLVLLGCACVLLAAMLLVTQLWMLPATSGSAPPPPMMAGGYRAMLGVALTYGALAVVFIWLGIGSIMARRWARTLVLILSWTWLVTGGIAVALIAAILPAVLSSAMPPGTEPLPDGARAAVAIGTTGCLTVFLVFLPVAFVLFYRSRHVKATCEARDPQARWTDACPLPVLGLSIALGIGAVSLPLMMALNRPVFPCFGVLLSGAPAAAALFVMAAAWAYCAWATCKMQLAGWWATFAIFALSALSGLLTFWRGDPIELYRLMDYPEDQIAQIEQLHVMTSRNMLLLIVLGTLLMFGYLWYVRKHFRRPA